MGVLVREARIAAGLTQAQLAGSEMTKAHISHIEVGRVRPSLKTLTVIARRLGRDVHEFLDEADPQVRQKRIQAYLLAAQAAATQKQWDEVSRNALAGLALDPPRAPRVSLLLLRSTAEMESGRLEAALDLTDQLLREADPDADVLEIARAHHCRGVGFARAGQIQIAVQELELARELVERTEIRDPGLRGRLLVTLGTLYRRTNRTSKAITTYEAALALGMQSEQLRIAAQGLMGVGAALYDTGELEGAIANYTRALELFERVESVELELATMGSLAAVTFEAGDLARARELAERCKTRALAAGVPRVAALADLTLARLARARGDDRAALEVASAAAASLQALGDDQQRADALTIIGLVKEDLGDTAAADRAFAEAMALMARSGIGPALTVATTEYADVLAKRGDLARAYDLLKRNVVVRVRTPAAPRTDGAPAPGKRTRTRGRPAP